MPATTGTTTDDRQDPSALTHSERSQRTHDLLAAAHTASDEAERRDLLNEVIVINRRVARAVAQRYRGRGVSDDDLEQAACEGLVKAAAHFDPTLRHDFLSYAVPSIRGEVQRYFRDHSWTIRPPRRLQQLQWRLNRTIDDLTAELGHEPTKAELCARMEITEDVLAEVEASFGCFQPPSLDRTVNATSDLTLADVVPADSEIESAEARAAVVPALRHLKPRDREIVYLRFYEDCTQQEIGERLGVTQMQVSRLITRILRDLRDDLGADLVEASGPSPEAGAEARLTG